MQDSSRTAIPFAYPWVHPYYPATFRNVLLESWRACPRCRRCNSRKSRRTLNSMSTTGSIDDDSALPVLRAVPAWWAAAVILANIGGACLAERCIRVVAKPR